MLADIDIKTQVTAPRRDSWCHPVDFANDVKDADLSKEVKAEVFNCAYEYIRGAMLLSYEP